MLHQLSAPNQAAAVNLVKGGKALKFLHVISLKKSSESHVAWMLKNKHFWLKKQDLLNNYSKFCLVAPRSYWIVEQVYLEEYDLEENILDLALMYEALLNLVSDLVASLGGVEDIH